MPSTSSQHTCCHVQCWGPRVRRYCLPAYQEVGTLLTHLAERKAFAQDHSGSEQGMWPRWVPEVRWWAAQEG